MSELRIATTAVKNRIYAGRVNKAGNAFSGTKRDVTSDVLRAVVDFVGAGQESEVTVDGQLRYVIRVVEVTPLAHGGYSEWKSQPKRDG